MQTVSLSWQHSAELAGVLAFASVALRAVPQNAEQNSAPNRAVPYRAVAQKCARILAPFAFEAAILALLYGVWQFAGRWSVTGTTDALRRARWIDNFDKHLLLPSERSVNHAILGHPLLVQAANLYYDSMHFTMMFVFLIWLFVRHRDKYQPVRTTVAWATLGCLLVQLIPVAPPRMLPGLGFVDTAMRYGESVYQNGLAADQLSAMPSVHVAWAVIVGYYTVTISPSRWRWIAAVHTALTIFVVVATANHWWLDGIVATCIVVLAAWTRYGTAAGVRAVRARLRTAQSAAEPANV